MNVDMRPSTFAEFIGQKKPKQVLEILCRAAGKKVESVSHLLLSGQPGLGKTTLARIVANEMKSKLIELIGFNLQQPGQLIGRLTELEKNDVLFIDEIHSLPRLVEEILYGAMEDWKVPVMHGEYDALMKSLGMAREEPTTILTHLPHFTLIGATTMAGLVSAPLRSRFVQTLNLEPYSENELQQIISNAAHACSFSISPETGMKIARRSRSTARVAIQNLKWVIEFCTANDTLPDDQAIHEAFALKDIDEHGLTKLDRQYLSVLVNTRSPVGIETLATFLGESADTLKRNIEPFLIQERFIRRTPQGRMAEQKTYAWMNSHQRKEQE